MSTELTDPLALDTEIEAAGVDTSVPLLPEGDYVLQISDNKFVVDTRNDANIPQWIPVLVTTAPITAVDGRNVPPNTPVFLDWNFDLKERPDTKRPGAWKTSLFNAYDAIFGTNKDTRPNFKPSDLRAAQGRTVIAKVVIDTYEGTSRNKVKGSSFRAVQ